MLPLPATADYDFAALWGLGGRAEVLQTILHEIARAIAGPRGINDSCWTRH
jgi:hypothetical protein